MSIAEIMGRASTSATPGNGTPQGAHRSAGGPPTAWAPAGSRGASSPPAPSRCGPTRCLATGDLRQRRELGFRRVEPQPGKRRAAAAHLRQDHVVPRPRRSPVNTSAIVEPNCTLSWWSRFYSRPATCATWKGSARCWRAGSSSARTGWGRTAERAGGGHPADQPGRSPGS